MEELKLPKSVTGKFYICKLNEEEKLHFYGRAPRNQ